MTIAQTKAARHRRANDKRWSKVNGYARAQAKAKRRQWQAMKAQKAGRSFGYNKKAKKG